MRLLVLLATLGLAACRDAGEEPLSAAVARHQALVLSGESPRSPKYDEVLALLAKVPPDARRSAEARRLETAIATARAPVRAPLALAANVDGGHAPRVLAQLRVCERLAMLLGVDGGVTPNGLAALEACRNRAERTEYEASHGDPHP